MTSRGPGITKIRCLWPTATKEVRFHKATFALVEDWLAHADIVSEGRADGGAYYGSTHVRLPWARSPHLAMRDHRAMEVLQCDPHLRVLVLRIARREAESRCPSALHIMRADLSFSTDPVGFVVVIDVDANISSCDARGIHS